MHPPYQTVVVEDDPMIALIDRSFLEQDGRFQLVRSFRDGQEALDWLLRHPAELLILDVYMPRMTGVELLRALRAAGVGTDAIMVTAANDSRTVDALLKLGVTDYLVKPFTAQRFHAALEKFCRHRETVDARESMSQRELDALLAAGAGHSAQTVPKGLQAATLELVRGCLPREEGVTCEEAGRRAGLSAVTARRYLTYLVARGEADSRVNYDTGGRPSLLYFLP